MGGGVGRMPVILGPAATLQLVGITASDSRTVDALGLYADRSLSFFFLTGGCPVMSPHWN